LIIPIELVNHYPWLPSRKKHYSDISGKDPSDKDPIEFISEVFSKDFGIKIKERLLILFNAAFENLEEISDYKIDNLNIYVYLLLKILLYALDNRIITNRVANLYSKIAYSELKKENDSNLYYICQDLGLNIKYYDPPINYGIIRVKEQHQKLETNFALYFIDYLKLASTLRDEYRQLVHNALSQGYVLIQNKRLIRLIQEYVRNKLLLNETKDKVSLKEFLKKILEIKDFKEVYDKITEAWTERKEEFEFVFKIDFESKENILELYPPCVGEILRKAKEGRNLIHNERLFIVWFLLALEYPVEEVVDLFSTMPDFDKEKTYYQVNFAKKKKYVPYKCLTLKSLNLCMAKKYNDELCLEGYFSKELGDRKNVTHPLRYTRIKQYRASKEKNYTKKQLNKKNE